MDSVTDARINAIITEKGTSGAQPPLVRTFGERR
jgi:hypothetical protein